MGFPNLLLRPDQKYADISVCVCVYIKHMYRECRVVLNITFVYIISESSGISVFDIQLFCVWA